MPNEKNQSINQTPATTRDATDLGVPMRRADPNQPARPAGPEDALGDEPTRGDYSNRLGGASYQPHEIKADPDAPTGEARGEAGKQTTKTVD